jgi:hypothetical protein
MSMKIQSLILLVIVTLPNFTHLLSVPPAEARPEAAIKIALPWPASFSPSEPEPISSPSSSTIQAQSFSGFSGQFTSYVDTYNGFKLNVPVEFPLHEKGATTDWTGPLLDGGAALIYINATPLKGVPSQVVYNANLKSKQTDRNFTQIVPMKVKLGNTTVLAFRCKESNNRPGTPNLKTPDDIHRWFLFVFGNQTVYTIGFTGPFQSFQTNKLQSTYEAVIRSVELVPIR